MKSTVIALGPLACLLGTVACSVLTAPTPTPVPLPTVDFRATESVLTQSVFATLTAAAPTATSIPTITLTPTKTATLKPTVRVPSRTPTIVPSPTRNEAWRKLCAGIPAGMAGLVVTSYIGEKEIVVIVGKNKYVALPMRSTLVPLPMGEVEITFTAPGWGANWHWVQEYNVVTVGRCEQYEIWYTRQ